MSFFCPLDLGKVKSINSWSAQKMRSIWKGPFVQRKLWNLRNQIQYEIKQRINPDASNTTNFSDFDETFKRRHKIWARGSMILPQFVGLKFSIHNGKDWIPLTISEDMIGHRFGEFAPTRKPTIHKEKTKTT